ncbi:hypothetical protein CASFOL_001855 [Castilleja foliolosa]|uniref:Uncharacterized protein n=1 Tax=Castilleja foliolosa TaxID=1961234 RepID=A0ABD3CRW1_9LAMI
MAATVDSGSGDKGLPRLSLEVAAPEFRHRLAACGPKRPGLDTIVEEHVYCR